MDKATKRLIALPQWPRQCPRHSLCRQYDHAAHIRVPSRLLDSFAHFVLFIHLPLLPGGTAISVLQTSIMTSSASRTLRTPSPFPVKACVPHLSRTFGELSCRVSHFQFTLKRRPLLRRRRPDNGRKHADHLPRSGHNSCTTYRT